MLSESAARHAIARSESRSFKVAEQQQPQIPARRQTRPPDPVRVERRALRFHERIAMRSSGLCGVGPGDPASSVCEIRSLRQLSGFRDCA